MFLAVVVAAFTGGVCCQLASLSPIDLALNIVLRELHPHRVVHHSDQQARHTALHAVKAREMPPRNGRLAAGWFGSRLP